MATTARAQTSGGKPTGQQTPAPARPQAAPTSSSAVRAAVVQGPPRVTLGAKVLADCQNVGENLAGMKQIGEAVDHRHRRELRQLLDFGVSEGANHDAVDVSRQNARGVGERLAAAELNVVWRQKEGVSPQLPGSDFERHAGSRG